MNLRFKKLSLLLIFFLLCTFLPAKGLNIKGATDSISEEMILKAVEDGLIDNGKPEINAKDIKNSLLKPKANKSGSTARIAYIKFDKSTYVGDINKAIFEISANFGSGITKAEYNIYGIEKDDWNKDTMNWVNTPNHEESGYKAIGEDAKLLGKINILATEEERSTVKRYSLDVTDYVKNHKDNILSFMIIDEIGQDANINIRAFDRKEEAERPSLTLSPVANPGEINKPQEPKETENPNQPEIPASKRVPHYEIKAVTSSNHDGNVPENTIDGKLDTRWSDGVVTDNIDGSWIKFDLGEERKIGYLGIAFYNGNTRQTNFDVEISSDGVSWVRVLENQWSSGNAIDLEKVRFLQAENARYVKIIGHGNNSSSVNSRIWNSMTEVEIYEPKAQVDQEEVSRLYESPTVNKELVKPFMYPGFVDQEGKEHPVYEPNRTPIKILDVTKAPYNTIPNDGKDDAAAIQQAINDAAKIPGTEVYLPNGTYELLIPQNVDVFIQLKSGVNLRGESQNEVILLADASKLTASTTRVIKGFGVKNILISNMTITTIKPEGGKYSTDTKNTNPNIFGVDNTIQLGLTGTTPSENIVIENVNIEHFKKAGVRIEKSHDVVVRNANFKNATTVAGGGQGYGVVIQGTPKLPDHLGKPDDTYYNLVENCSFVGPYIRHGALIQNYAHNNVVRNNTFDGTLLDSIDLHGEDEYLNEVYGNIIKNVFTGGAIGIGNTGGTYPTNHDESGPSNYIHHNIIENTRDGINVIMGSPKTRIENNIFRNSTVPGSRGIVLKNAPGTIVKNNNFIDNTAPDFISILLTEDFGDKNADFVGAGIPEDITIEGNSIVNSTNGIVIEKGKNIKVLNNTLPEGTSGLLIKDGENIMIDNEKSNASTNILPQTGSKVDLTVMILIGAVITISGILLSLKKKAIN
jgi:LPXTG-motif cell wall-anchored protein